MTAISWKPAAAIALVVIVVAAGAFMLLRRGGGGTGDGELPGDNAHAGEVLFKYEASFTYIGSGENLPLVECSVQFPCPTVGGEPALTRENLKWQLWGPVEGENGARWLELEVDNNNVFQWVGRRANSPPDNDFYLSPLGVPFHLPSNGMNYWDNSITWKISLELSSFDNIYLGEMLKSEGYFSLPAELASNVTLRENDGRVLSGLAWRNGVLEVWDGRPEDMVLTADISFSVKLLQQVDNSFEVVEEFRKVAEDVPSGYRYPISLL